MRSHNIINTTDNINVWPGIYIVLRYIPYSRRVAIIADVGFWTISRFKFRESAPRQSHTLKFDAIKTTPLFFHTCVEITQGSFMSMSKSELWSCVVKAMIHGYEYQSIWEAEIGETWRVSESMVTSVTPTLYNNSWTRPKKNVTRFGKTLRMGSAC